MKIDIENLPKSTESLHEIVVSLYHELTTYKTKYESILEQIRLAKQKRFASSSEKNLLQPDIFDEAGVELPDEVKEQLQGEENTVEVKAYKRKKENHPVRKPLPKDLPREVIVHDIPESEKICVCGECLVKMGEEITEQLKYIPEQLSVVRHVRPKYACKPCGENVKIAKMPILLLPKSIATPELVAQTIVAKYCDHLPLYRQEQIWNRHDIDLPRSSLCGWILKTAELCSPLVVLLKKNIIRYDYTQADETTIQVLNEADRENSKKSYMWCYRGGKDLLTIVYEYQETRGGYHAENFLSGFRGFLQTDAYSGYNWVDNRGEIISLGCHAHARRNFSDLVKISKTPGLAHEVIKFYEKLYKIESDARKNNLPPEARYQSRLEKSLPILTAFKKWLDHHLPKTSEQGKIGKAIRYCLKNWSELTNYLKDGRLEIDNNLVENAIRPFALGRKNWLFMGSPSGAKAGAVFYSLIETCKANGINPNKYFCSMLHQIRLCKTEEDFQKLLPQNLRLD